MLVDQPMLAFFFLCKNVCRLVSKTGSQTRGAPVPPRPPTLKHISVPLCMSLWTVHLAAWETKCQSSFPLLQKLTSYTDLIPEAPLTEEGWEPWLV